MDHKDRTRTHYDSHANAHQHRHEAIRARRQSPAWPLRRFHNDIKRKLIIKFCPKSGKLLDLCCGRGGDIQKWEDAGASLVVGLDLSPGEIQEAEKRYNELKEKCIKEKRPLQVACEFAVCDTLGEREFLSDRGPFDTVTCMFALHYFFRAENELRMLIRNVANNLKPGGHFIATIPDGKRVLWHLAGRQVYDSHFLKLEKRWQGDAHHRSSFNLPYLWELKGSVTEGTEESEGSLEFLTFRNPITRIAAHYGLEAVTVYEDRDLDDCFEVEDVYEAYKHFCPRFGSVDESLAVASSTFMAVVFRKVAPNEPPPHVDPPLLKDLPPPSEWGPPPPAHHHANGNGAAHHGAGPAAHDRGQQGSGAPGEDRGAEAQGEHAYEGDADGYEGGEGDGGQEAEGEDAYMVSRYTDKDEWEEPDGGGDGGGGGLDYGDGDEEERPGGAKRQRV